MQKLPEVNFKKTFPLFDEKVSCPAVGKIPAFDASVSGSVDACIVANVSLAVTAVGTLVGSLSSLHQIHLKTSRCLRCPRILPNSGLWSESMRIWRAR